MPSPAIRIRQLRKEYALGGREQSTQTFREMLSSFLKIPSRTRPERDVDGGKFWALRDVSFDVGQGEVLGVIGRNGAGKSTLLKIMSRITEPTAGRIEIRGRVASLLEVGTGFHPELTGRENIFLNGAILGMTRMEIRRKFDEIVAYAEVERFLDLPVKRYSSGMYMRLAFSVAAHLESDVMLIDEVLAVGDAAFQKKCLTKMGEVARGGRTVIFVSHQLASILNLCTTTIVLEQGRLRDLGPSQVIVNKYLAEIETGTATAAIRRPSWAEPFIVSVQTKGGGIPKSDFELDGAIEFEMTVSPPRGRTIREAVMGVVIRHPLFGIVGGINTRMAGYKTRPDLTSSFTLSCRIRNLPLLHGSYSADLWFGDGPTDLDVALEAVRFNIHGTDVYGTGRLPTQEMGIVLLKADWGCRDEHG